METIEELILGKKQGGDQYRHENLSPAQIKLAETRAFEMGLNARNILTDPKTFNDFPIEIRKRFFEETTAKPDSIESLILGKPAQAPPAVSRAAPSATVLAAPPEAPPEALAAPPPAAPQRQVSRVGPFRELGQAAASLYDVTLGGIAPAIIEPVTYAATRAAGKSPEQAKEISTAAAAPFESPMGRRFGVTETPGYQEEPLRRLFNFVGENFQKGAAWIAEKTGLPTSDVENMMGTVAAGAGVKAAPAVQRGVVRGAETAETALGTAPKPAEPPRVEPSLPGKPRVSYAEFQAQLEARKAGGAAPILPPAPKIDTATMPAPTLTQPFPEIRYAKEGFVNLPEQVARKQVLSRIGLKDARESSIFGDGRAAADEFQTTRVDAPVGQLYRDTFANERAALESHGQRIIERTGGTMGLDETALYNRGTKITRPFDDFKAVLQNEMNQAYEQARQVARMQPAVAPSNIQKFLDTDSNFTVNDSFMALRRGIQAHLRENNLVDANGKIQPMTVEQAENLSKYVNSNWNNERSRIIGQIKDQIDNDVTRVAGEVVYKKARDTRTKIGRLLDDPKGVAKIMDYDPRSPMNRAVPFEKIATTVERMSLDQQQHLLKLLREMPEQLRPQADAAIAEIKAQFANRMVEEGSKTKGQWNAANVTKYLNDNNRRLGILMEDKELAQMIKDLNDAGHILKYDASYPGAAIQAHNLIKLGAMPLLGTLGGAAGTAIGASMFGPGGAALGGPAGATLGAQRGAKMAEKSALRRAQRKMVPLKEVGK